MMRANRPLRSSIDLEGFLLDNEGMNSYVELIQLLEKFADDLSMFCDACIKEILDSHDTFRPQNRLFVNWCSRCLNEVFRDYEQEHYTSIANFANFIIEHQIDQAKVSAIDCYALPKEKSIVIKHWFVVIREDSIDIEKFRKKYDLKPNLVFEDIGEKLSSTCGSFVTNRIIENLAKKVVMKFDTFVDVVYGYANLDSIIELYGHVLLALVIGCQSVRASNPMGSSFAELLSLKITRTLNLSGFYDVVDDISNQWYSESIDLNAYLVDYANICSRFIRNCTSLSKVFCCLKVLVAILQEHICESVSTQVWTNMISTSPFIKRQYNLNLVL